MFSVPVYEDADMGAYSIQIEQARRFALLVGNYSREKFNHPGPAFLYVQAWGEDLFYALLRVVPAAWNGEVVGLYLLSAFFAACVVVVGWRWGGMRAGLVTLGVVGLCGALHPSVFSSDWMPYEYVPAYLAFLVSVASVAGGRTRDSWIAALSGWFLIHGHACFLLFVPLLWLGAAAARLAPHLRRRTWPRPERLAWLPVAVISAVFALPIAGELALHWPGNFGKYFAYSGSARSGGHPVAQVARYALWFWWPHAGAWAVAVILALAAAGAAWRMPAGPAAPLLPGPAGGQRRLDGRVPRLRGGRRRRAERVLHRLLLLVRSRDHDPGGRCWRSPNCSPRAARDRERHRPWSCLVSPSALALAGCTTFAVAPQTRLSTDHADPGDPTATGPVADPSLPAGVARIGALAAGRYAVLAVPQHDAWPAVTGILVQAERTGVPACVAGRAGNSC